MLSRRLRLTKNDLRGVTLLGVIIAVVVCVYAYLSSRPQTSDLALSAEEQRRLAEFSKKASVRDERERAERASKMPTVVLHPFDPNTADSATLCALGLRPWQVRNMLKYRRAGGRWKSAEDFRRLYGLSADEYERLRPYIVVDVPSALVQKSAEDLRRDSLRAAWHDAKFHEHTFVDINAADTTLLKRIPGIGSYYAQKICKYRERLGGFVCVEQIAEIDGLPKDFASWCAVSAEAPVRKLNVNRASFRDLLRHPYLDLEQVKLITNYRDQKGRITSLREFPFHELFPDSVLLRLEPYISY